ncbi:MAG: sigma-54-dependent Fis family transcriptional regulator [Myxococcales bacterium]|nr:sigma-54-dependent Fis family transcriptional regulator [Myxococcales bacterium]
MTGRILVIDDDQNMCDLLETLLTKRGFEVTSFVSAHDALDAVATREFDAVLTDLAMTPMTGIALCERILGTRPDLPVILVTGVGSMELAISAMRAGAYDFITKPVDAEVLGLGVARAVQHKQLLKEVRRLRTAVAASEHPESIVGTSSAMKRVYDLIARVGDSAASVLIQGPTGTGKELIARAIHAQSPRSAGPFVAINCAAVPPTLLESELFGHARGAFTDAKAERKGLFLEASGGTLFLDEIGELPLEVQPKLLRALQERKVRPVGSNSELPFDVRIVSATNRNLEDEVFEKRFREDFYYRINVVKIELPPLKERGGDILALAQHFLTMFAGQSGKPALTLSASVAKKLMDYDWPGNVRELENCIERTVALAAFDQVTVEDLPEKIRAYHPERFVVSADDPTEVVTMAELERKYVLRVVALVGGNRSRAAEVLGFDRRTLYRKLKLYAGAEDSEQEAELSETGTTSTHGSSVRT